MQDSAGGAPAPLPDGVVVVGAGVAGLSAAAHLRAHGVEVTVLEAGPCIGGRARTAHPAVLRGDVLDLGAAWLHAAASNPLVPMAAPDDDLVDSDALRTERLFVAGRAATPAEQAAYEQSWDAVEHLVPGAADTTLAALLEGLPGPWVPTIALWEGAIIAAADADELSAHDWHRNLLPPPNLLPRHGLGSFVARRLATPAWLETPAQRIRWDGLGVQVTTPRGTLRAAACIVTASTGVLAGGGIAFDPPLPAAVQTALAALPMGQVIKVALPGHATALPGFEVDRLGLPDNATLVRQVGAGEAGMTFSAWPLDRNHLVGFMGGRAAAAVAGDDPAAEAFARDQLRAMLGPVRLGAGAAVTGWGTDPLFRGAYSFARPGGAGARAALGDAFPAERLLFAGEATCTDGLAGTVGGAWLSGRDAAARLMTAAIRRR